jgi:hypothetical protein
MSSLASSSYHDPDDWPVSTCFVGWDNPRMTPASCSIGWDDPSTCSVGWDCSASSLCGELIIEIYVNEKHGLYCISNSLDLDRSRVESPRGLKPIIH